MTLHRRRCLTKAILEIKGRLSEVSGEQLLNMNDAELLALFIELEKLFTEGAVITEPMPTAPIEALDTIIMEAVPSPKKR